MKQIPHNTGLSALSPDTAKGTSCFYCVWSQAETWPETAVEKGVMR